MKLAPFFLFGGLALSGCAKVPAVPEPKITVPAGVVGDISYKMSPRYGFDLERHYLVLLPDRNKLEMRIHDDCSEDYAFCHSASANLTQPDGKNIAFDPDAIADKIIDSSVAGETKTEVASVYKLDQVYRKTPVTEFTDDDGRVWQLVVRSK